MATNTYYGSVGSLGGGGGSGTVFPLLAPNGTAAAPSYSFSAHTSTGWYYDATNSALASSVGGTENVYLTASSVQVPAANSVQWVGSTVLNSSANGTLQITSSTGTFGSLLLGATGSTTGVMLVATNDTITVQSGSGGNGAIAAAQFNCSGVIVANTSNSTNTGLALGNSGGVRIDYSGTSGLYKLRTSLGVDGQGFIVQGQYTLAKTTNYNIAAADSGTHFTTTGAAGSVQFTLPVAVQGYRFMFTATAAQTMTVTVAAGSIFGPGSLTGSTRTVLAGTATIQYSSFEVVCYDGTNYVVRCISGTVA